ncbi:TadA family conjugal transfer-associated ATPase [Motilibacter aurantiacus]|uniref:TadA family conjugal transfer-associated ATPase n=1 Tax=Motilibacter aurantiacus TaxID=2714955 RepID=UPI001408B6F9|nr:TadA family conjugal transfer-associated ATPase [Motilibacter aurantiacus]NHC44355.1 TadA family conjugal transfer-associated ATPase [Motilibacter aurantiacus]
MLDPARGVRGVERPDGALLERVRSRLVGLGGEPTPADVAEALRAERGLLGDGPVLAAATALRAELAGVGPLEPLLADPRVTDVLVNGPRDVWVDRGGGLERADAAFVDESDVRRIAERLATSAGRRLDDGAPWVEARLPQGLRLHAVIPPVAVGGTCLSLRVPARKPLSLTQLAAVGAVTPAVEQALRGLVRARASVLVTGGTGAGKTTLLAALLGLVPAGERIVIAEDTTELAPDHPHVVRLEGRAPNVEGAGEVTLRQLVRQALRMRPDRLVVGEVRGPEVPRQSGYRRILAVRERGGRRAAGALRPRSPVGVEECRPSRARQLLAALAPPAASPTAALGGLAAPSPSSRQGSSAARPAGSSRQRERQRGPAAVREPTPPRQELRRRRRSDARARPL